MGQKIENIDLGNLSDLSYIPSHKAFNIIPNFNTEVGSPISNDLYVVSTEQNLQKIIPEPIRSQMIHYESEEALQKAYKDLCKILPHYHYTYSRKEPYTFNVSFLNYAQYSSGTGRYIPDMLARWLLPGHVLPVTAGGTVAFRFVKFPSKEFLFSQFFIVLRSEDEVGVVLRNIDTILKELRINILAVYYARYILSVRALSFEQKTMMIEEYISSLLDNPRRIEDSNIHDQMQQFLIKLSADEKYDQVNQNIRQIMHTRPKNFNQDVFYEIRHFMVLFRDKFTANRDPQHISRVIAFQYLFKKNLLQAIHKSPEERHISIKILKTRIKSDTCKKMVLGFLIAMNFIRDTERFDKRHVLEAIRTYVPDIHYVKDSYILERGDEKIRTIYLEVEKKDASNFTFDEIKELKNELTKEIKDRVENVVHPIFMPRNEEEIMRNMIILSKQLKYVRDIPQVIITYEKQTDEEIIFNVILVRLLKHNTESLKIVFEQASHLKIILDETKVVGYLKRKYPKEVNLFHICLNKFPFFRKDSSLDLQKARRRVVHELTYLIGEFRDFNGGMIVKQSEALDQLRTLLQHLGNRGEFLLENFFYSLRPAVMQSILSTKVMKALFLLLLDGIEQDFSDDVYNLKFHMEGKYLLVMISAPSESFKETVQGAVSKLKVASCDLTTSVVNIYEITTLGYAYRFDDIEEASLFKKTVKDALDRWKI